MTSSLLNPERIRSTIRRMFSGTHEEVVSELLQNAQRIKASHVSFDVTTEQGQVELVYRDNGPGLHNADAFLRLLSLGGSGYDAATEQAQNPMGFGFNALLAHEDVEQVIIESNRYQLVVDTARWWQEVAYAESWQTRLSRSLFASGLKLTVRYRKPASGNHWATTPESLAHCIRTQASSYFGYFTVLLNGAPVEQKLPGILEGENLLFVLNTRLQDGTAIRWVLNDCYQHYNLYVRWYGQLVQHMRESNQIPSRWALYLDVQAGQPVDLIAPTRKDIVRNEKFEQVLREASSLLFEAINAMEAPTLGLVEALEKLDANRYNQTSRFALVHVRQADQLPVDGHYGLDASHAKVLSKAEFLKLKERNTIFFLNADLHVHETSFYGGDLLSRFSTGVSSFLPYAPKEWLFMSSASKLPSSWGSVPTLTCHWKVGEKPQAQPLSGFRLSAPGEVAFSESTDLPASEHFKPLPKQAQVHASNETTVQAFDELDQVLVGSSNLDEYLLAYGHGWLGSDLDEDAREAAITTARRSIRGQTIATNFCLQEIQNFLQPDEFVLSVKLHYGKLNDPNERPRPSAITVTTSQARKVKLNLYA